MAGRVAFGALTHEFQTLVSYVLGKQAGTVDTDRLSAFSTALAHATHVLDTRRAMLDLGRVPTAAPIPAEPRIALSIDP